MIFFSKNRRLSPKLEYSIVIVSVLITTIFCFQIDNSNNYYIISFIYLFTVSLLATFLRLPPILLSSTLSALLWNFFFIPPHYTFHISKTEDVFLFFMFYAIALVNGVLTNKIKNQEQIAIQKEEHTNALFELTKNLSKTHGIKEIVSVSIENLNVLFNEAFTFVIQNGKDELDYSDKNLEAGDLTPDDKKEIEYVYKNKRTKVSEKSKRTYHSLSGTRINLGVIISENESSITPENRLLWETCVTQIANALERELLAELASNARILAESDKLYKTLFNSVSHEFRIPVATILGASDTLLHTEQSPEINKELNSEIFTASLRLDRLIENLLNISRLENGRISPRFDWYDCYDLANKVSSDLQIELAHYKFETSFQDKMPLVQFDFGLMEQILYNLILNSCENSPKQSCVCLDFSYNSGNLIICIKDEGTGFPNEMLPLVFTKFFRVNNKKTGGLGLGLSIVKGFVEAHNGTITVENNKEKGASFIIKIPTIQYEC